jgi:hypothetical protein
MSHAEAVEVCIPRRCRRRHRLPPLPDVCRPRARLWCAPRTVTRPPTVDIFKGARSLNSRVEVLIREMFAYYERYPQYERARCDQDQVPGLAEGVRRREAEREGLVGEALRVRRLDRQALRTVSALTDFAVYRSLSSSGISAGDAASQITEVVLAWLPRSKGSNERRHSSRSMRP